MMADSLDTLIDALALYGFDITTARSMAERLWGEYVDGSNQAAIDQWVIAQPEFDQRFPGLNALRESGNAVSPQQWRAYEDAWLGFAKSAGLPSGLYDTHEFIGSLITNRVSVAEAQQRVQMAEQAVWEQFDVQAAAVYGMDPGDLTAMLLDPAEAQPFVERKFKAVQSAKIAQETSFGQLTAAQAEQVGQDSSSPEQTRQGFSSLANQAEVFNPLDAGETTISTDEQIAAQFQGNAEAQEKIRRQARRRVAEFEAGGGFIQGQRGYVGVQ